MKNAENKDKKMRKISRYISVLLILILVLPTLLLTSCDLNSNSNKISIICSTFAQYDFTMNILGEASDKFDVAYLLESGIDMHSYSNSISVSDKVKILSSDLFICIGGSSEKWIGELLLDDDAKEMKVLKLIDCVGELVCDDSDSHKNHDHSNADECDEHIWLSPKRAIMMCDAICKEICDLDNENAEIYAENNTEYKEKLEKLDNDIENTITSAKTDHIIFADRFPFVYLTNDYGIGYSAVFDGCSAETNATYETVVSLVKDINEKNIKVLITLEKSKTDIADTLIAESGRADMSVMSVISMQNVSKKDIDNGMTYISVMYENLEILGKAMN